MLQGDNHRVSYDPTTATVTCSGFLDLRGKEGYKEIVKLLDTVAEQSPSAEKIILDIRDLEFLNSSGITTLGGFVIKLRNKGGIRLMIKCSNKHSWQSRSMKGLEKLMSEGMELVFE